MLNDSGKESARVRRWPTALTVWFLILLGIFRPASYENLLERLHGSWWTRRFWSPKEPPGTSGVTKARDRIGVEPLRRLFYRSGGVWVNGTPGDIVAGRRAVAIDGICFEVFDSEANRECFGTPGCSRGSTAFPQVRTVQLSDVASRFVVDVGDEIVELRPPPSLKRELPGLPDRWKLRRIRYRVNGGDPTEILTTILDPELLSKQHAVELYHDRWEIENSVDEVKTHLCDCATVNRPPAFRGKTPQRVEQEIYATLTAYNAVPKLIAEAAPAADVDPHRISFVAAVERAREAVQAMQSLSTNALPLRYRQPLNASARVVVPFRPGRSVRRGVRIKMSKFPLKYEHERGVAA